LNATLLQSVRAQKKMMGRFIIGLMTSSSFVLAASIILGVAEFVFIATLARRDRMIYHSCLSSCIPKSFDVLVAMRKHKLMRVRCAHMETVLEVSRAAPATPPAPSLVPCLLLPSADPASAPACGALVLLTGLFHHNLGHAHRDDPRHFPRRQQQAYPRAAHLKRHQYADALSLLLGMGRGDMGG
jgi:hypothetical protein